MNNANPQNKKRRAIEVLFSVAITVGILGFLFSQISLTDLTLIISEISIAVLALVFVLMVAINALRAYRFRVLLSAKEMPFVRLTGTVLVCNFVTNILPAGIGHLSYPVLFQRNFGVPLSRGIAILLLARIFDLMIIFIIFLLSAALAQAIPASMTSAVHSISLVVLIALILLVSVVVLVRFSARFASRFQVFIEKSLSRGPLFTKEGATKATKAFAAVRVINSNANLTKVIVTSLGIWTGMYLVGFVLLRDLNVMIDIATSFTAQSLTLITMILPVQGIGGFGSFEGAWAGAFFLLGVPKAVAILSGVIIHLILFIYHATLGIAGAITIRRYLFGK